MKLPGFSSQTTMSIFSPRSSSTMLLTREPLLPTQAPMGSTLGSLVLTAILVRLPGSRAMLMISMTPSLTSATSCSNSLRTRSGCVRLTRILGPRFVVRTSRINTLTRSVGRRCSPGTCSFSLSIPSALPRLTLMLRPIFL